MKTKCYLASELGFSELGRWVIAHRLIPFLEQELGVEVLEPFGAVPQQFIDVANSLSPGSEKDKSNDELLWVIQKLDDRLLAESDWVLAVLDGMIQDVGVVSEVAQCGPVQRPVLGYRGDFRIVTENYRSPFNCMLTRALSKSIGSQKDYLLAKTLEEVKYLYFKSILPLLQAKQEGGGNVSRISSILKDAKDHL